MFLASLSLFLNAYITSAPSAPWIPDPAALIWLEIIITLGLSPYAAKILLTLSVGVIVSSVFLIIVASTPFFLNSSYIYLAISRVKSFSLTPVELTAPLSVPPCPASMTTFKLFI